MNIKRYQSVDMRGAIRKVREAMGPDAVILSNKYIDGGVEIVAAVDYDESLFGKLLPLSNADDTSLPLDDEIQDRVENARQAAWDDIRFSRNVPESALSTDAAVKTVDAEVDSGSPPATADQAHIWSEPPVIMEMRDELMSLRGLLVNQLSGLEWGNETRYHPQRARLLQRLLALGLSSTLARDIAIEAGEDQSFEHCWRKALGILSQRLPVCDNPIIDNGGIVALVGATGVGKTTTIAKLAARYVLRNGPHSVALVTTDNFRVSAHEQLKSYAHIMGVPMMVATDANSLQNTLDKLSNKRLILIDTAGMSQRDMELGRQLALLKNPDRQVHAYLALASNSQRGAMLETAQAYKQIPLSGCVFTKLDETTSLGGALSVAIEQGLPVAYYCDGQRVPEDLHPARAHNLVTRSLTIMQQVASTNQEEKNSIAMSGMVAHAHG